MATKASPPHAEQVQAVHPLQVGLKRVFSQANDDPSNPVFMNAVDFSAMGMDVFMDVGVVSPEAVTAGMANKPSEEAIPIIDLHVFTRFGMSFQTAMVMHQRLTEVLARTQAQVAIAQSGETKAK